MYFHMPNEENYDKRLQNIDWYSETIQIAGIGAAGAFKPLHGKTA